MGMQAAVFPHGDAVSDIAAVANVRPVSDYAVGPDAGIGSYMDFVRVEAGRWVDDGCGMNAGGEPVGGSHEIFHQGVECHGGVVHFHEGGVFRIRRQTRRHQHDSGRGVQEVLEVFFIAKEGGFFTGCVKKGSDPEYGQFGVAGKDFSPGEGGHGFKCKLHGYMIPPSRG